MPFSRTRAKTRRETVEKLRSERDLRHEDQALAPGFERRRDSLEIDFRLAGAGDAFEQGDREIIAFNALDQDVRGFLLRGFQGGPRVRGIAAGRHGRLRQRDRLKYPLVDQRVDNAARTGGGLGERGFGEGEDAFRCREDAGAGGGHPAGRASREAHPDTRRFRPGMQRRGGRHPQNHAARAQGPGRYPIDEFSQIGGKRGNIEARGNCFQIRPGDPWPRLPDDAIGHSRAERHFNKITRRDGEPTGKLPGRLVRGAQQAPAR